jgi:hypothetical protein
VISLADGGDAVASPTDDEDKEGVAAPMAAVAGVGSGGPAMAPTVVSPPQHRTPAAPLITAALPNGGSLAHHDR